MNEELFDIAIIGSGPAGIEAAVNAVIRNKKIIIFGNKNLSPKLTKAHRIDNYLGFYQQSGEMIKNAFVNHLEAMNIQITEEKVNMIYPNGDTFMIGGSPNMYLAKKIILATGVELSKSIENEIEFLGRGVSYCATCDAPLYKDREVVVVGYSEESIHEANYLSEIAAKVTFIPVRVGVDGLNESIEIMKSSPLKIEGEQTASKLILKEGEITFDGLFILRDSVEPSQLMMGIEMEGSHIKVNRKMETNIPGVYAAGDCVGKPYQYMKAAGEGQVAALNCVEELDKAGYQAK